jgi:carbonic anhydrase
MTTTYASIFDRNRAWADGLTRDDPGYFERLAATHEPHTLYIGCSDARVPVTSLTQTEPGELFVHRNVANLVVPTCASLLAVLQYAVQALKVRDVVVCGHHGCGGVKAAMREEAAPVLVEGWIANVRMVARLHDEELAAIEDEGARYRRLVELNVIEQVRNLSRTVPVREAWAAGSTLRLHGIVYDIHDGLLRDLGVTIEGESAAAAAVPGAGDDAPAARAGSRAPRTSDEQRVLSRA